MKLGLLIGSLIGLVMGVALTIFYFSLATFFKVNANALNVVEKAENAKRNAGSTATKQKRKAQAG